MGVAKEDGRQDVPVRGFVPYCQNPAISWPKLCVLSPPVRELRRSSRGSNILATGALRGQERADATCGLEERGGPGSWRAMDAWIVLPTRGNAAVATGPGGAEL